MPLHRLEKHNCTNGVELEVLNQRGKCLYTFVYKICTSYHVVQIDKWIVDCNDLYSLVLQGTSHNKTTNPSKSAKN